MNDQITFVIFSMDSPEQTAECVTSLGSENVIIFYTSTTQSREKLQSLIPGFMIVPAPGFGYPEPLRLWAESFVNTPYVFIIDTDERLSEKLQAFLSSGNFDSKVYKIFRIDSTGNRGTWQTRLYKKGSIRWRGLVHEQPEVKAEKLPADCTLLHNDKNLKHSREYNALNSFMPQSTIEVIFRSFAVGLILDGPKAISYLPQTISVVSRQKHLATKEDKEIRKAIKKEGLIGYLRLDDPEVIKSIIAKHGAAPNGTSLLVKLMRERYTKLHGKDTAE